MGTIATYDAYFAEPKEAPKAVIVLISDIFGWAKKNIRIYADKLAAAGELWLPPYLHYQEINSRCWKVM